MLFKRKPRVHVFCRHAAFSEVSQHKKRQPYFSRIGCFQNLISTLDPSFKLTILLDTKYGSDHFVKSSKYPVVEIEKGTEAGSFLKLLDLALSTKHGDDDIFYFLEDDYLHRPGWCQVLLEAFDLPIDYVTLYDHRDKYTFSEYEELKSKIYFTKSAHFRTIPSTTNTFAMRAKTLKRDLAIHQKFSTNVKVSKDHEKFCKLSEKGVILVSSIPGYSTHMEPDFESPCVNWKKIQMEYQNDSAYTTS